MKQVKYLELFLNNLPEEEIDELVRYYDYLEVQPLINNKFLVNNGRVENKQGLIDLNKRIIELGKKHGKPVVATCDAHYIDEDDQMYRRILMAGQGFKDLGKAVYILELQKKCLKSLTILTVRQLRKL